MGAREPDLLQHALPARFAPPHRRTERRAVLVERQRVIARADMAAQLVVVKVHRPRAQPRQDRERQTQRAHRIPHAHRLDGGLRVAMAGAKHRRALRDHARLVIAEGAPHPPLHRALAPQQAHPVDQPGEAAHRIGAAAVAEQENAVAGAIAAGQRRVACADCVVDALAGGGVQPLAPADPLHAGMIGQRLRRARPALAQQPIQPACVGLAADIEARQRAVHDHHMVAWRSDAGACLLHRILPL